MESLPEKELTLRDLLTIYRRRRKTIYGTLFSFILLGALYCAICTRRYEAKGTIQVQKSSADAMNLSNLMSSAEGAGDALSANIDLQTQANILQSDTLALETIKALHMETTKDFRPRWNPGSWLLELFSPSGPPDAPNVALEDAPRRRRRALKVFSRNLKVKPVSGTRLIEIDYSNPDPKLAAAVVNTLTQSLADYSFETRYNATNLASQWLSGQLSELRKNSEDLQAKVVALEKESGVYSLGTTDAQGREQAYSGILDQLQQATSAMDAAEQNRILKGAVAHAAESGDAEMLSGLAGNAVGQSPAMTNSLTLIQNLRQQEATATATLQQLEAEYGPDYPKVIDLRSSVAGLQRSIRDEINRLRGRAQSDYQIAQQTATGAEQQYEQVKKRADLLNDKAIEFAILSQESQESRELYEDLLKRLKEAGILEGLRSSNITVVDPGRVPAKPDKPNVPLYMAIALGGGLFFGCLGALVIDTLDNKVNGIPDIEQVTGQTVLGALPFVEDTPGKGYVVAMESPDSIFTEAVRSLRTAILLWRSETPPKVLLITSSIAGEGKSGVSANLAAVLAQYGRRVLLVDADLRRGTLRKRLRLAQGPGLSAMLSGQDAEIVAIDGVSNLYALQAGTAPPNPSELLDSDAMRARLEIWKKQFDFVILDGTPVLPVTDAVALNVLADATLLVARNGLVEKPQVRRSYQTLLRDGKHPVGVVLNGLRMGDNDYYGYYGYRKDPYGSSERSHDA